MRKNQNMRTSVPTALEPKRFNADIGTLLPDVSLTIGGKERQLRYDLASVALVEKLTGINLFAAAVSDASNTTIRALLYASLLPDDPEVTPEEVASWVRPGNIGVIHEAVLTAWFESRKPAEPKTESAKGEDQAQPAS